MLSNNSAASIRMSKDFSPRGCPSVRLPETKWVQSASDIRFINQSIRPRQISGLVFGSFDIISWYNKPEDLVGTRSLPESCVLRLRSHDTDPGIACVHLVPQVDLLSWDKSSRSLTRIEEGRVKYSLWATVKVFLCEWLSEGSWSVQCKGRKPGYITRW